MSERQNKHFVLEVKKYPCLYNSTLSSYSRKSETDRAWDRVGKAMKMSGAACKEKWRNLRIVFLRHVRTSGASGDKKKRPYYLLDVMQFITPFIKQATIPMIKRRKPTASVTASCSDTESLSESAETAEAETNTLDAPEIAEPTETVDAANQCQEMPGEQKEYESVCADSQHNGDQYIPDPKGQELPMHEPDQQYVNYAVDTPTPQNESQTSDDMVSSFINSLAPELHEMNLQQFKVFKRRVLSLIDEIMMPAPAPPVTNTLTATPIWVCAPMGPTCATTSYI